MDWRAINFDWNRARAFLVTAEEGTFSAAARALGSTQPTIGRQVSQLEDELGVMLFERVGTSLELTQTGVELLEHVRVMGNAANLVSLGAAGQSTSVEGDVSITASEVISAYLLPPVVAKLRDEYPKMNIEIVASNESRDLLRREADVAIRNFRPEEPDLIGRELGKSAGYFYGSHEYIEQCGGLESIDDIDRVQILAFDRAMVDAFAGFGLKVSPEQFPVMTPNHLVQWSLCKLGVGLCMMMQEIGDPDPSVARVFPEFAIPIPMWVVAHRELRTNRRVRVVFDALVEHFSSYSE